MERTTLVIDGTDFVLAEESDLSELKDRIADAARTGPSFVDFVTIDARASVLIGPGTRVVFTTVSITEAMVEPDLTDGAVLAWSEDIIDDGSLGWLELLEARVADIPLPHLRVVDEGRTERAV